MNLRARRKQDEAGEGTRTGRPRGATTLLLVAAAVLGLGGGTAYGYHVQADRHPKPLPPLAQSGLSYPKKTLPADAKGSRPPLEENQDHQLVYRGGLDRLVVAPPKGWKRAGKEVFGKGTLRTDDIAKYAVEYDDAGDTLAELVRTGAVRFAGENWTDGGGLYGYVRLIEFRPGAKNDAAQRAMDNGAYFQLDDGTSSDDVAPGTTVFRWKEPPHAGYPPMWGGAVFGSRGNVNIEMVFFGTSPVSESKLTEAAKKQWERL
ncbi:hypothetical protein [Streptomyces sp. SID11385]|uniref:hypothetical protein n=1 Tax=Streptomyces sp. SID11385 TaxID=2706031 RepID=UPI0013CA1D42|nr:hypothetical protein [Streptomyces sp. SID11385]